MKRMLLTLLSISALSMVSLDTQASIFGVFRATYRTTVAVLAGSADIALETAGIVVPGVDKEDRDEVAALEACCCCNG